MRIRGKFEQLPCQGFVSKLCCSYNGNTGFNGIHSFGIYAYGTTGDAGILREPTELEEHLMPTYRIHIEYPEDPLALKTQVDPEVLAYLQKHRILVWGWNSPWFRGNTQTDDGIQLYFRYNEDFFEKFQTELAKDFYVRAQENRMR